MVFLTLLVVAGEKAVSLWSYLWSLLGKGNRIKFEKIEQPTHRQVDQDNSQNPHSRDFRSVGHFAARSGVRDPRPVEPAP